MYCRCISTVVPVFSGPRDERPPTMYGHFSKVPIDFQRICPLDQRTPTERGRGQHFFIIIHLLKRTVIAIWVFIFQNKQNFIVVYDIFKDGVAHFLQCTMHAGSVVFVESQETASNPCEVNPQLFLLSVLYLFR